YTDVWQLRSPADLRGDWGMPFNIIRMREGVKLKQAGAVLALVAHRFATLAGESPRDVAFRKHAITGNPFQFQRYHIALIAAVLAVLFVACFNLEIGRASCRERVWSLVLAV